MASPIYVVVHPQLEDSNVFYHSREQAEKAKEVLQKEDAKEDGYGTKYGTYSILEVFPGKFFEGEIDGHNERHMRQVADLPVGH